MTRSYKVLGALVAALALSVAMTSVASAESDYWFKSDGSPTHIIGEQVVANGDVFKVDGGQVRCEKSTLTGNQTGTTASTLTLEAEYDNCKFAGTLPAIVDMNSCDYVFHTDENGNTTNGEYHVRTTIECEDPGDTITVTVIAPGPTIKCTIHVTEQDLGTGIVLTNDVIPNTNVEDITAHIKFTEIEYTQTAGTGFAACPTADETTGGGDTDNGVYEGEATLTGFNANEERTSIWVE